MLPLRLDTSALAALLSALPASHATSIVSALRDYAKTVQQERTKRQEIEARERVALEAIRTLRDFSTEATRAAFAERAVIFDALLMYIDRAIDAREPAMVTAIAMAVADIAKTSPVKGLGERGTKLSF